MSAPAAAEEDAALEAPRIVEVDDERDPVARSALELLRDAFPPDQRQPLGEVAMEIAEKRLRLLTSYDFHLFAAADSREVVVAIAAGVYLGGVNAGFVTYLAVRPEHRSRHLGRQMRTHLVEAFRSDARNNDWEELRWVLGEVRTENPWIHRLVRDRGAVPFDLAYFHPGMVPGEPDEQWVLYRQPVGDSRIQLPVDEVKQLLYAIWRRAYRVRWPLEREGFRTMLAELDGRELVGSHPSFG
jgi:GNAT superfamily N-acetyltransferase